MVVHKISSDDAQQQSFEELCTNLSTTSQGLSSDESQKRLAQFGPNALEEKKTNPILKFLSYFWGPIPWMIEIAAVLSAIVQHWDDLVIISVLLLFNALVGFWQEHKAGYCPSASRRYHSCGRQAF
jgi:H+-transporting ATPase